jgi:hypothetical protein
MSMRTKVPCPVSRRPPAARSRGAETLVDLEPNIVGLIDMLASIFSRAIASSTRRYCPSALAAWPLADLFAEDVDAWPSRPRR